MYPDDCICSLLSENFNSSSEGLLFIAKDMWLDALGVILFELKFITLQDL